MPIANKTTRILICDDHALLREGVATLLSAESDMKLIAEASTGEEAAEKFRTHRPDMTLMGLRMPGSTLGRLAGDLDSIPCPCSASM